MYNTDAQTALAFLISQLAHIESQVNEIVYPDIQYQALIPVDTGAGEFAQTVTYYTSDKFGKAEWLNLNADDIPLAGTEHSEHSVPIFDGGIGFAYSLKELGLARHLGIDLTADRAAAARRAYEEMVDGVAMLGDATKGFQGLINNTGITPVPAPTGDWGGTGVTADEILADVNAAILDVATATNFTSVADTLLLPFDKLNVLATTRLPDTSMTILEFLRQNNTYTAMTGAQLVIRGVRGLDTAGLAGVARMVAYRRDPQVLKLHIPKVHTFGAPYMQGPLRVQVPGTFSLGGLDIRRPAEIKYVDGI